MNHLLETFLFQKTIWTKKNHTRNTRYFFFKVEHMEPLKKNAAKQQSLLL